MVVDLKKFYKRNTADTLMFGYVNALLFNFPTVTVEKAILNFMKHHNLNDDIINTDTVRTTYYRMQKEYIETQKSE